MKVVCLFLFLVSKKQLVENMLMNEQHEKYWQSNRINNTIERTKAFVSSIIFFLRCIDRGLSGIENDKTKKESHREWYLSIVQSYIIQRNKKVQIDLICYYRYNITTKYKYAEKEYQKIDGKKYSTYTTYNIVEYFVRFSCYC
jgi:hypothetical protein